LAEAAKTVEHPGFKPSDYAFHGRTEGVDNFTGSATAGPDVFCGFGGNDFINSLDAGDIFLGGAGDDGVSGNRGTFYGGEGNDSVLLTNFGTVFGEEGNDFVANNSGIFHGGAGLDTVVNGTPPKTDRRVPARSETATREGPGRSSSGPSSCPYSPKCVVREFSEVELPEYRVLGSPYRESCMALPRSGVPHSCRRGAPLRTGAQKYTNGVRRIRGARL
jgi:hypothetical protein